MKGPATIITEITTRSHFIGRYLHKGMEGMITLGGSAESTISFAITNRTIYYKITPWTKRLQTASATVPSPHP